MSRPVILVSTSWSEFRPLRPMSVLTPKFGKANVGLSRSERHKAGQPEMVFCGTPGTLVSRAFLDHLHSHFIQHYGFYGLAEDKVCLRHLVDIQIRLHADSESSHPSSTARRCSSAVVGPFTFQTSPTPLAPLSVRFCCARTIAYGANIWHFIM